MSSKVALIETVEARISSEDLQKLEFVSSRLGYGLNRSKTIRHLVRFFAEYLAEESEAEARCI